MSSGLCGAIDEKLSGVKPCALTGEIGKLSGCLNNKTFDFVKCDPFSTCKYSEEHSFSTSIGYVDVSVCDTESHRVYVGGAIILVVIICGAILFYLVFIAPHIEGLVKLNKALKARHQMAM